MMDRQLQQPAEYFAPWVQALGLQVEASMPTA